jgi:hypothetical protein
MCLPGEAIPLPSDDLAEPSADEDYYEDYCEVSYELPED